MPVEAAIQQHAYAVRQRQRLQKAFVQPPAAREVETPAAARDLAHGDEAERRLPRQFHRLQKRP